MKKKHVFFAILFVAITMLIISPKCLATDLDEIEDYNVVVEPRMNDGSLDITYEITWKVLDSSTEGPLEWVQIGTPNSDFDNPTALSKNIRSIKPYNGPFVKIIFNKKYYAGDTLTFKYKIHQSYMYKISFGNCKYSFKPAWFTDIKIKKMTVKWNMDEVKSSNCKSKLENYLIWTKKNMSKGEKIKVNVKYKEEAFGNLNKYKQSNFARNNSYSSNSQTSYNAGVNTIIFLLFLVIVLSVFLSIISGGYYGHRGFYGGYYGRYYGGGCVRSSCACACVRSSCACACAGSGRAGCSRKDFYGTKINKQKLKKVFG